MMISVYVDGASRGNPGDSGVGVIIQDGEEKVLYSASGFLGKMTNNAAEYYALIFAIKKMKQTPSILQRLKSEDVIIYSDSELIVRQMSGQYKVKEPELKKLHQEASKLLSSLPSQVSIKHIKRGENREADRLANFGIESKVPLTL